MSTIKLVDKSHFGIYLQPMAKKSPLSKAIEVAGGQSALGRLIGVRQQAIYSWVHGTGRAPAERVLAIEKATGVPRHELRPDIYPREDRCSAA